MRSLLILALLGATLSVATADHWVVCYFSSWAVYRPGDGRFDVEDLDPNLCTHAIFGFAGLSNHTWTIEVLDPWNENCPDDDPPGQFCAYDRFVALKEQNPDLKVILAVGGWNEGSEDYSVMVADKDKRKTFVQSCLDLVQKHGFDGLDIDWEYPTLRGGVEADKEGFIKLLDEIREKFDKHGLLMTAALASGRPTVDAAYNVEGLIRNLDILSIMTYDYHGAWENFTHHNAPLCGYPGDEGDMLTFNVVYSIQYWLELGAPPEKVVMGIPLYGRCFTLDDINNHGMLANASEAGVPGPYTQLPGTQGWNEICERIKDTSDCTVVHDVNLHEPYMYCKEDDLWCGYDDEASIYEKARFAKNMGLAGTMVWTVDTDDFMPTCGDRKFSLINTQKEAFALPADGIFPDCSVKTTTPAPSTTATPVTTTSGGDATTTNSGGDATTTNSGGDATTTNSGGDATTTNSGGDATTTNSGGDATTTNSGGYATTTNSGGDATTTNSGGDATTTNSGGDATTTNSGGDATTTNSGGDATTTNSGGDATTTNSGGDATTTNSGGDVTTYLPSTTPGAPSTTPETYPSKPDCDENPDKVYYPHEDCNKYWWCVNGEAILMLCSPGTYFDVDTGFCLYPEDVDTTHCRVWVCEADGDVFAGVFCNEYYECEHGAPVQKFCADGLYFNPEIEQCDNPSNVDPNTCNPPL